MKKILLNIFLVLIVMTTQAQDGLERIFVERYYVSEANDTNANPDGGVLPVQSTTYRIYVDMLPGYKFQAAYGSPSHELRMETTTLFFNNEDRGATAPSNITRTHASHNTVMLDSWLSAGAACSGNNYGIRKIYDDGVNTVMNTYSPQVLQGTNSLAGIPLTVQDGFIAGTNPPEMVQTIGIDNPITVFDNQNDGTNGPVFSVSNGSWFSFNGAYGPDSMTNEVLIAQITTNGVFSFELNIQIGTPTGGVQKFVARNPSGTEISIPSLIYVSNVGVQNLENKNQVPSFSVYPNPASDNVTLEIRPVKEDSKNSYTVCDEMGRIVISKSLGNFSSVYRERLDISALASGLYFIQLTSGDATSSKKIIKY